MISSRCMLYRKHRNRVAHCLGIPEEEINKTMRHQWEWDH
jgi:hypothetical protein